MSLFEQEAIQTIMLERLTVHIQRIHLDAIGPMVANTAQLVQYYDAQLGNMVYLLADMCKGETIEEIKTVEESVSFKIFETWWDHFKYYMVERKIYWLPSWLINKIKIRYRNEVKKIQLTVPVKVTRACPHATFSWDKNVRKHLIHLYPSFGEFKE